MEQCGQISVLDIATKSIDNSHRVREILTRYSHAGSKRFDKARHPVFRAVKTPRYRLINLRRGVGECASDTACDVSAIEYRREVCGIGVAVMDEPDGRPPILSIVSIKNVMQNDIELIIR